MNSAASTPRKPLYLERNPPDPVPSASAYFMRGAPIPWPGPMRVAPWVFLLAIGLAASLLTGAASAGVLVEFPNVSEQPPARLFGYLARPGSGVSAARFGRFQVKGPPMQKPSAMKSRMPR